MALKPAPVPLSTLAPKPNQSKQDPKAQNPKNVADLKSALAAVLGDKPKKEEPKPEPQPKPAPEAPKKQPGEVPEDVLKKVLKVD